MLKDEEMSQNDAFEQIRGLLWDGRISRALQLRISEPNPAARKCTVMCTKFVLVYFFEFWPPDESVLAVTPSCHDFYDSKEEKKCNVRNSCRLTCIRFDAD